VLQNSTGHVIFLSGMPADPVQNGKPLLIFKMIGDEYTLEELQGDSLGAEFVPAGESSLGAYGQL